MPPVVEGTTKDSQTHTTCPSLLPSVGCGWHAERKCQTQRSRSPAKRDTFVMRIRSAVPTTIGPTYLVVCKLFPEVPNMVAHLPALATCSSNASRETGKKKACNNSQTPEQEIAQTCAGCSQSISTALICLAAPKSNCTSTLVAGSGPEAQ